MIAANVSEEYGYIGVRIHVQYTFSRSRSASEKVIVKGIEINATQCQLETVFIDERTTGSRTDYSYRINDLFEGEILSIIRYQSISNIPPQYTVNDDIAGVAIYVNGNSRYVLSDSNNFCIQIALEDKITSLVLVPIWASGGELIEDAVIIPLANCSCGPTQR